MACLVYDAVTCGRSQMDPKKRMYVGVQAAAFQLPIAAARSDSLRLLLQVKDMMWLPNDVEAFHKVLPVLQSAAASAAYEEAWNALHLCRCLLR